MLEKARVRDAALEGRRILIVEDDVRNVFALTRVLEIARRHGRDREERPVEAIQSLEELNGRAPQASTWC